MQGNIESFGLLVDSQYEYTPHHLISLKTTRKIFSDQSNSFPSVGNCYSGEIDVVMRRISDLPPAYVELISEEDRGLFFRHIKDVPNYILDPSLYITGETKFTIDIDSSLIPRMARLEPFIVNNNNYIKKGVFFIDTREVDSASDTILNVDTLTLHGYDSMLKTEQALYNTATEAVPDWASNETYYVGEFVRYSGNYYVCIRTHDDGGAFDPQFWEETVVGDQGTWPKTDLETAQIIAERIGVSLSSETEELMDQEFEVQYPGYGEDGYTLREVLGYIGAMYGGNWVIDDNGDLALIQLNGISLPVTVEHFESPSSTDPGRPYSRVTVDLGSDYYYTAGDDTGEELIVFCPWGTQDIADYILTVINDFQYVPFKIDNAIIDPSWKLGDKIKIDDVYSYIYSMDTDFNYLLTADIEAPNNSEIDHEYQFKDSGTTAVSRALTQIKTTLRVQTGEIEGLIEGEIRTFKGGSEPPIGETFHAGDLWYCEDGSGFYKINTWYRFSGSTWEETTGTVPVAPNYSGATTYVVGDVVTGPDGKWYKSKVDNNTGHQPPNTDYWEECTTITAVSKSQILQTIDAITLSVNTDGNGSQIRIQGDGINVASDRVFFETDNAHFSGTLEAAKVVALGDDIVIKNASGARTYGSMGYGTGYDGVTETDGIVIKARDTNPDSRHYFIVTDSGVRMQAGDYSIYVADSGCYIRHGNSDPVRIGTAVFG